MAGVRVTRAGLLACLAVPRWADDVLAGMPYDDAPALLSAAAAAARSLSGTELDQALASHPGSASVGERSRDGSSPASTPLPATRRPGWRPGTPPTRSASAGSS